jgi:hypothetical protein
MVDPPTSLELPEDSPLAPPSHRALSAAPTVKTPPPNERAPEDSHVYLRQDAKVYLVKDWATLQRWIMERRVGRDDEVSEGGTQWGAVGERPELGSFFLAIEQLEALEAAAHGDRDLPTAATPIRPSRRERGATGLARLDDDTEGVPIGLPPLPTEDLDSSDPQHGHLSDEAPPSRLTPVRQPRLVAAAPEPPSAPRAPSVDEAAVVPTPPTPPDALLVEDDGPLLGAAAADLSTPPGVSGKPLGFGQPSESFDDPPTAPSTAAPSSGPGAVPATPDDLDLEDPFEAYERPVAPSLPPLRRPQPNRVALALWSAAIAVVVLVLTLVGWGFATGRLGGPRPAPPAPVSAPIIVPAPPPVVPPPAPPPDTDADSDAEADTAPADADASAAEAAPATPPATPAAPPAAPVEPAAPAAVPAPVVRAAPTVRDLNRRGVAELDARDYAAALATFQTALQRSPNDAQAQFGAGYALVELGRGAEARSPLCAASAQRASAFAGEADIVLRRLGATCP